MLFPNVIFEETRSKDGKSYTVSIIRFEEAHGPDFYVFSGDKHHRTCPSEGMAREVVAGL